jgi:hypothetical protein
MHTKSERGDLRTPRSPIGYAPEGTSSDDSATDRIAEVIT